MKKITILLFLVLCFNGFSQSKSTQLITFGAMTAKITLDNATSKATIVLTGPSDRWFGLGLGVQQGFNMGAGDVLLYTSSFTDRNFVGKGSPATDTQDWSVTNVAAAGTRTLTLVRALTNSDSKDFQMPYATESIDLVLVSANSATTNLGSNHRYEFVTGTFSSLGVDDFSLSATTVYPNPTKGAFFIKTKTNLSKVNVYNQTGAMVKTIDVKNDAKEVELGVNGIQSGVYFLELQNASEKSWKKIIIE